jgi:hypothetical protein
MRTDIGRRKGGRKEGANISRHSPAPSWEGSKQAREHLPQLWSSTLEDFSPAGQRSTLSTHPTRQRHAHLRPGSYIVTAGGLCLGSCSTSRPVTPTPKVPPPSTPTGPKQQKTPCGLRFFGPGARPVTRAEAREPRLPPEAVARTTRRVLLCPAPAVNMPASCQVLQPKPHEYGRLTCRRDGRPRQSPCRRETLDLQSLDGSHRRAKSHKEMSRPGAISSAVLCCAALRCAALFCILRHVPRCT